MARRSWAPTRRSRLRRASLLAPVLGFAAGYGVGRVAGPHSLWTQALVTYAFVIAFPQLLRWRPIEQWTGGVQGLYLDFPTPPVELPQQRPLGLPDGAGRYWPPAPGSRTT